MSSENPQPATQSDERRLIEAARSDAEAAAAGGDSAVMLPSGGIPGYEILHEIHRGGQGVVYRAHQKSAGRTVAIKVMREGPFAGPLDRARFDREVRILGALRHPNIVAIHDSGQSSGHFYYVMDYIAGQSLDAHVAERKPDLAAALKLFLKICDAVNAAHLRGIVHRDLKPGNVRVDAAGEPFILDFGLARGAGAWAQSVPQPVTVTGQFIGSLQWASPEQTEGIPDRVDMRTDVYSLGMILFHMLTGKFPYDVASEMWVVVDQIRRAEPVRPRTLRREIDDDLETILLKCLRKDRERRYQTSGELAKDLRHYLAGEAIEAKRDSSWYVLRKTLQRHRAAVTSAALVAVGLVVFSIVTFAMYRTAEAERARAQTEAMKSRQTVDLLTGVFAFIEPEKAKARDTSLLREALDHAASRIEVQLGGHPELAAELHLYVGELYMRLGYYDAAAERGRRAEALVEPERGRATSESVRIVRFLILCEWKGKSPSEALGPRLEEVLALRRSFAPDGSLEVTESLYDLGRFNYERANYPQALGLFQQALDLLDGLPAPAIEKKAEVLLDAARTAIMQNDHARAESFFRQLDALLDDRDTKPSLILAEVLSTRALQIWRGGKESLDHVAPMLTRALRMQEQLLPEPDHPTIARTKDILGLYLFEKEYAVRGKEGLRYLEEAYRIRTARLQHDSDELADSLHHYASALIDEERVDEAEPLLSRAIEIRAKLFGAESPQVADLMRLKAEARVKDRKLDEGLKILGEALAHLRSGAQPDREVELRCLHDIGALQIKAKEWDLAADSLQEGLNLRRAMSGGGPSDDLAEFLRMLAQARREQKRFDEAIELLNECISVSRQVYGAGHEDVPVILNTMARTLIQARRAAEAEKYVREAVALCDAGTPCQPGKAWEFQLTLGECIFRQNRLDEAEPILTRALDGLKAHQASEGAISYAQKIIGDLKSARESAQGGS
ncbi:MAG: serine/threonine protein kinase [Phycisphaerales bacterium]|nr:serine/threonine protein kinase [Phycisphaerales bacterium]